MLALRRRVWTAGTTSRVYVDGMVSVQILFYYFLIQINLGRQARPLRVLTNSLHGLDYKLHIILNKADQFKQISDYARAYGSLCWNLSKVIPRKDLPCIHTMCLPVGARLESEIDISCDVTSNGSSRLLSHTASSNAKLAGAVTSNGSPARLNSNGGNSNALQNKSRFGNSPLHTPPRDLVTPFGRVVRAEEDHFLTNGLDSLEAVRRELEVEIFKALTRRVDNEISRLSDSVHALTMHCKCYERLFSAIQQQCGSGDMRRLGLTPLSDYCVALLGSLHSSQTPSV